MGLKSKIIVGDMLLDIVRAHLFDTFRQKIRPRANQRLCGGEPCPGPQERSFSPLTRP